MRRGPIVGVLLAAGSATRFGADKLNAPLPGGVPVGIAALKHLRAAVDEVIAVVRPGDASLAGALQSHGARISVCPGAADGMGVSLAWGVRAAPVAAGWVIALADMPWVRSETIAAVVAALESGAMVAAPECAGTRGHPVGFAASLYAELIALTGDEGAKSILARHPPKLLATEDTGILRDVDTPADLQQ
jgi:molybdenum cofactor cytidylyltransferase